MKIHLQSDIHLEMGDHISSLISSDVCVCAGDIGTLHEQKKIDNLKKYLTNRMELAEHVIWVLGNHEYYHMERDETLRVASDIAADTGVILMDEALGSENQLINGVKFWGTTFWSDLKNNDPMVELSARNGINDFFVVKNKGVRFTTQDMMEINTRSRQNIDWSADVIITHFPPVVIKHSKFDIDNITYYFCNTGLDEKIRKSKVKYWLCGHTHDSFAVDYDNTLIVSNQHGYRGYRRNEDCGFNPNFICYL